jgi:hypothetical protein
MFPHHQRQQQKISGGGGGSVSGFGLEEDDNHDARDGVLRILRGAGGAGAHDDVPTFRDDYDGDDDGDDDEGFASVVTSRRRRQQQHRQVQRRRKLCAVAIVIVAVVAIAVLAAVATTTTSTSTSNRTDNNDLDAGDAQQSSVTGASDNPQQVSGEAPAADADDDDDESNPTDDAAASYPAVADDDNSDDDDAALSSVFVMPDASALESYCGYSLTLSEGFGACEIHCAPSACCRIPSGVEGSCLNDQAYACQVYRDHCAVLDNRPAPNNAEPDSSESPNGNNNYGAPSRNSNPNLPNDDHMTDDAEYQYKHIAAAPDDIESVCSMEAMSASLDGLRACAKYCVNAYCCYDMSPYDCRDKQPHCADYVDPCTRLQAKLQEP